MQKTKPRHDLRRSGKILPYAVMSILIAIIGLGIESTFSATNPYNTLTLYQISIAVFTLRLVPILMQVVLIERFLKQSMRGWFLTSALGTLVTLSFLGIFTGWSSNPDIVQIAGFLIVYVPTAVLQTLWLRRHVSKAWLWPLLVVFVRLVLPDIWMRFESYSMITTLFSVHPVIVGTLQAFLLYYLLAQPKNTEKAKVDFAADATAHSDHSRIERLQEIDRSTPLWDTGDEQSLQSEA